MAPKKSTKQKERATVTVDYDYFYYLKYFLDYMNISFSEFVNHGLSLWGQYLKDQGVDPKNLDQYDFDYLFELLTQSLLDHSLHFHKMILENYDNPYKIMFEVFNIIKSVDKRI